MTGARALAMVAALAAVGVLAAPSRAATPVKLKLGAPKEAVAGQRLTVRLAARSRAERRGSTVQLLLSRNARRDRRDTVLRRVRRLGTLRARKTLRRRYAVRLPAAGRYRVLGCVRLGRAAKPRCVASRAIRVRAAGDPPAAGTPVPPFVPGPAPSPAAAQPAVPPAPAPSPTPQPSPTPSPEPVAPAPGPADQPAPDPAGVAPPLPRGEPASLLDATAFLYGGADPIQDGVAPGAIDEVRASVLRGTVSRRDGSPIAGVRITVAGRPELGRTATRTDGGYDVAVNGGGPLSLVFEREGFIPAQRLVDAPWQDYAPVDPVVMIPYDSRSTLIAAGSGEPYQVARAAPVTDDRGTRTATLLFERGTQARRVSARGDAEPMEDIRVRATEFTVGAEGIDAMPGQLPPATAYTYALELSVDEAVEAGAAEVTFDKPVVLYTENFLDMPVGIALPVGSFDRSAGRWVGERNGAVLAIVAETGGRAGVDLDGDGQAEDAAALAAIGMDDAERERLAALYEPGAELWRTELGHFSPWDINFPYGPGENGGPPGAAPPTGGPDDGDPCARGGSVILCESQVLGETLPIAGTGLGLVYRSDRVPGRTAETTLDIPVTGPEAPPASVLSVELEVRVAGRTSTYSFEPAANLAQRFEWDRRDAYGRPVPGAQPVRVRVGYTYRAVYQEPAVLDALDPALHYLPSWAQFSGFPVTGSRSRQQYTVWQEQAATVGSLGAEADGLGGWALSNHHAYDPQSRSLIMGDGSVRDVDGSTIDVIHEFAGSRGGFEGDGGPAAEARLDAPQGVAHAPDGAVYIADTGNERIRRVTPAGTIETVAGNGAYGFDGDGAAATAASLSSPEGVAVDGDGDIYVADSGAGRIRRFTPGGAIRTIAGGGRPSAGVGDGGAATEARLSDPSAVAVAPDGAVYVADTLHHRVRMVATNGLIWTVAGTGAAGFAGDGGPARGARLRAPQGVAVDADGRLLIADTGNGRVRRIGLDGVIETIAGGGDPPDGLGDGGPATAAYLAEPAGVATSPDGSTLVADAGDGRIRRILSDGRIATFAGGGSGGSANGSPATAAGLGGEPSSVAASPLGDVYVGERNRHRVHRLGGLAEGFGHGSLLIAAEDGRELYEFSDTGRHLRTLESFTGAVVAEFAYDAAGRLVDVHDPDSTRTAEAAPPLLHVDRGAGGAPQALVARGGQVTSLELDGAGFLASVENPAGDTVTLDHDAGGLLRTLTDARGGTSAFTYDDVGRLIRDEGPGGLVQTLTRTELPGGAEVEVETGGGRAWSYRVEQLADGGSRQTVEQPDGGVSTLEEGADGTSVLATPDGTVTTVRLDPDPRFGMQAPVMGLQEVAAPGGLTRTTSRTRTATSPDGLTLGSQEDVVDVNGSTLTGSYDGDSRTLTTTTAEGRVTTTTLDARGRAQRVAPGPGIEAIELAYDERGRVESISQGARGWTYDYDAGDRVRTRTNAAGDTLTFAYDAAGRVASLTSAEGRTWEWSYDRNGNPDGVTLPGNAHYQLTSTPDDLPDAMTLPGGGTYDRAYTADRLFASTTLPSGDVVARGLDAAGRLTGLTTPETTSAFTFDGATERLATATWDRAVGGTEQTLDVQNLMTMTMGWLYGGRTEGALSVERDDTLHVSERTIDAGGAPSVYAIARDADRLVTGDGPWTIARDAATGEQREIGDGAVSVASGYDAYGAIASRRLLHAGGERYALAIERDEAGRVARRSETIGGAETVFDYSYDGDDRLLEVEKTAGGTTTTVEEYAYDADGNRVSAAYDGGPAEAATYDAQDRLETRDGVVHVFDADGFLTARGADSFGYDRRGSLLQAVAGGRTATYDYDAFGRLVRRTDGADSTRFLYGNPGDALEVTATVDEAGVVTSYFYDDERLLYGLERGGERYAVASDQVGSPHVVIGPDGAVVKRVDRDAFGRVLADSAPGFELPIGFAGGIADPLTGLVRFGSRDYDPGAGRWTARDPSFFAGSPFNLYEYVGNNPATLRDPTGLVCMGGAAYDVIGGGVTYCPDGGGDTWCIEVGIGVGASASLDLLAEAPSTMPTIIADLGIELGGGGSVGAKISPCGVSVGGSAGAGPFSGGIEINDAGEVEFAGGIGASAKAAAKLALMQCFKGSPW